MEQYQPLSDQPIFSLSIDSQSRDFLSDGARWAKFLAIVGFIICGILVLSGVYSSIKLSSMNSALEGTGYDTRFSNNYRMLSGMIMIVYVVIAFFYFFPCLFLFRFASQMRTALAAEDQATLTSSFRNLKALFKFTGIMTIIVIAVYALIMVAFTMSVAASPF